jgi:hypothetical protein
MQLGGSSESTTEIDRPNSEIFVLTRSSFSNLFSTCILFRGSFFPGRFVTTLPTSDFVGDWSSGANSFQSDSPNAALVLDEPTAQDVTIVELFNPLYDGDNRTLQYDVNPIGNITSLDLPSEFQQSTLVIDVSGTKLVCNGACWK